MYTHLCPYLFVGLKGADARGAAAAAVEKTYHALTVCGDAFGQNGVAQFLEVFLCIARRGPLEEQHVQVGHVEGGGVCLQWAGMELPAFGSLASLHGWRAGASALTPWHGAPYSTRACPPSHVPPAQRQGTVFARPCMTSADLSFHSSTWAALATVIESSRPKANKAYAKHQEAASSSVPGHGSESVNTLPSAIQYSISLQASKPPMLEQSRCNSLKTSVQQGAI